jgi:hypothetical protein
VPTLIGSFDDKPYFVKRPSAIFYPLAKKQTFYGNFWGEKLLFFPLVLTGGKKIRMFSRFGGQNVLFPPRDLALHPRPNGLEVQNQSLGREKILVLPPSRENKTPLFLTLRVKNAPAFQSF